MTIARTKSIIGYGQYADHCRCRSPEQRRKTSIGRVLIDPVEGTRVDGQYAVNRLGGFFADLAKTTGAATILPRQAVGRMRT